MQSKVYAVQCLTNLHMGSGDINFNVIDNEVQRDPVLNTPAMFASGVKGALRDHFEAVAADKVTDIFGSSIGDSREGKRDKSKPGSLKFLGGALLLQPVRAAKGPGTYFLITTRQLLLNWAESYKTFKGKELENGLLQAVADLDSKKVYAAFKPVDIKVEKEEHKAAAVQTISDVIQKALLHVIDKEKYSRVLVLPETEFERIHLPVLARNQLDNGISNNLWYEEVVPHEAVFYLTVLADETDSSRTALADFAAVLKDNPLVQFGGNATIGCGLTKLAEY